MEALVFIAFISLVAATFLVGYVAGERGRSSVAWFMIAAVTTPVMAILALVALGEGRPRTFVNKFGVVEGGPAPGRQ